jgi:AcrR family transcriptional regulator
MSRPNRHRPIWARPAPGARRPSYSREQIADAAIAIADAEGYEAVSMRRLAAELGAGTMSLYHYIRSKDELVGLVADRLMGEMLIPDEELPDGWREAMAELARRTLGLFKSHPWIVEHWGEGDPDSTGPSMLRHVEQTLAIAARSGLDTDGQFELAAIVDDYVIGYAMRTHHGAEAKDKGHFDAMLAYVTAQLGTGEYPHLKAMAGDDPAAAFARVAHIADDEQRFERGLERVLDGIELWVDRTRKG